MAPPSHRQEAIALYPTLKSVVRHRNLRLGLPVFHSSIYIPWGYERDSEKPSLLNPIEEHLQLLLEAQKQLASVSYRDVSEWLTVESGVRVSHQAIQKLFESRRLFKEAYLPKEQREALGRELVIL